MPGAPLNNKNAQQGPEPKQSWLQVRVMQSSKSKWVKAANRAKQKLGEWVIETLDKRADKQD